MDAVTIVNVFPRLLGTYGDSGNELALAHRLRARGLDAACVRVEPGDAVPTQGDLYLLGGGEDRAQALAVSLIDSALATAVASGAVVLGVCAGLQMLGCSFTDASGATHPGLGVLDVTSTPLPARAVGEVIVQPSIPVGPIVGFENHRGGTHLGPDALPLGLTVSGVGNGDAARTEGAYQGNVFGTYLHGPVLALNPSLADFLLSRIVGDLEPIDDALAERSRVRRLAGLHNRP